MVSFKRSDSCLKSQRLKLSCIILTVFDENFFDGSTEELNVLAEHGGRVHQVRVNVRRQFVDATDTNDRPASLCELAKDDAEVGDGSLDSRLQLSQVPASVLQT